VNWLVLIGVFAISVLVGSRLASYACRNRPDWTPRRRRWVAASIVPAFVAVLTIAGLAWVIVTGPGSGENMQDLALIVTAGAGAVFAAVALGGGLVGAAIGAPK
jgi:hypothetical protein